MNLICEKLEINVLSIENQISQVLGDPRNRIPMSNYVSGENNTTRIGEPGRYFTGRTR